MTDPQPSVIEVSYMLDIVRQGLRMSRGRWSVRQLRGGISDQQLQRLELWLARRMQRLGWTYIGPMHAAVITDQTVPGRLRPDGRDLHLWMTGDAYLVLRGKVAWGDVPIEHRGLLYRATGQVVRLRVPVQKSDRPDA